MLSQRLLVSKWLSPYRDVHGKQTGCYHRDCWSANGCLLTVMCTVSRLDVITETVGQQMAAKLKQHNLLEQFGEKLQA